MESDLQLKQRMITGLIGGCGICLINGVGGWFFYWTSRIACLDWLLGIYTNERMSWKHPASLIGYVGVLVLLIPWDKLDIQQPNGDTYALASMFLVLTITVMTKNKMTIDGAALMLLGALYVGYGFPCHV